MKLVELDFTVRIYKEFWHLQILNIFSSLILTKNNGLPCISGFPDCKPCDCPSTALCERDTGECICPPRVTGEKCDKCEPYTFGFDQIIGCELCNCNPMGVERGNLQCDLNNGTCK